jgi:hypothetical protein
MKSLVSHRLRAAACFALLLPAVLAGTGCAHISATSDVRADGSMTRTVVYSGTSPEPPKPGPNSESGLSEVSMSPRLEDLVALPTAAGGWKITRTRGDKSNVTVTASRVVAPGQTVKNDFGIRLPKAKDAAGAASPVKPKTPVRTAQIVSPAALLLENTVTVRQVAPGRLEYREVLHYRGPRPKEMDTPEPEMLAALKRALPVALASDTASLKQVGSPCSASYGRLCLGRATRCCRCWSFIRILPSTGLRKPSGAPSVGP